MKAFEFIPTYHCYNHSLIRRLHYVLAALLAVIPLSTLWMTAVLQNDMVWGDHVGLFLDSHLHEGLTLGRLLAFHNEHVIVTTKLVIWLDYVFTDGALVLPVVIAVLLALAIPALYSKLLCEARATALVCAGLMFTLYFNGMLLWDLTWCIMLQHFFVNACALLAAYALSRERVGLFVGACALASVSSANGILLAPVALMLSLLLVKRKLAAAALGAVLCFSIPYALAYRVVRPAAGLPPDFSIAGALHFAMLFLGGAYWRDSDFPVAFSSDHTLVNVTAFAFCGVLAWLLWRLWTRRSMLDSFELFHAFVILFVLATALSGALYRSQFGAYEAINKKYAPTALLAWLSAASLLLRARPEWLAGRMKPALVTLSVVLAIAPAHITEFGIWRIWKDRYSENSAVIRSGVYQQSAWLQMFFDETRTRQLYETFQREHKYMFRHPAPSLLASRRLDIAVAAYTPLQNGYTVTGSLPWDEAHKLERLVVLDANGAVSGYGHVSQVPANPHWIGRLDHPSRLNWFAAFRAEPGGAPLKLCAVDGSGAVEIGSLQPPTS